MESDLIEQCIGKLGTGFRLATGEGVTRLKGVRQVSYIHQLTVVFAIATDPTQTGAANVDPVVALGAANHAGLLWLTF